VIHRANILASCEPSDILARPYAYMVDQRHRLAKDMAFCIPGGFNLFMDITRASSALFKEVNANISLQASAYGAAWKFGTADNTKIDFGTTQPIVTDDGAGTGSFTVACVSNPPAAAAEYDQIGQRLGVNPANQWRLMANIDDDFNVASGKFTFGTFATAASGAETANTAVDGSLHAWVGRRVTGGGSSTHTIWRDGVDATAATSSTTTRDVTVGTQSFAIGGLPGGAAVVSANSSIPISCGWNRALSDDEIWEWSQNPFCMIVPRFALIVGTAPAAAASSIPVFMHNYRRRRAA